MTTFQKLLGSCLIFSASSGSAQPIKPFAASWIASSQSSSAPLPMFRKTFTLPAKPLSATLRISGLGQYEAHLNGHNVTSAVLTPGWTLYSKRVLYNTYDVTALLHPGANAISVMLGNGMYNVEPAPGRYTKFTGSFGQPKLTAELTVHFAGRPDFVVSTDAGWRTAPGPITFSHTYGGEDFDARQETRGWDAPAFDDRTWSPAHVVEGPGGDLALEVAPPVKAFETYLPISVRRLSPTLAIYDLGENFSGWPELSVTGPAGAQVKMLGGELLDHNGRVTQRSANAFPGSENVFQYTLRGGSTAARPEQWHPRFSYYGFRYVEVQSSAQVRIIRLAGRFLHADVPVVGTFHSSDPLLNRIHTLIDRAILSNLVSVITDCPHREKLGWLEQTHLAGTALMMNYDLGSLYHKISDDMADSQQPSGLVPDIAPELTVFGGPFRDSPEWGSAVILSPWVAYTFSGDLEPLGSHYASMQSYAAYLEGRSHNHLLDYGLGDWYDIGPGEPGESKLTVKGLTASAIYYQDLVALARIAALLHHPDDAAQYSATAAELKTAFDARFFHPETNLYDRGSQTAQAMPLVVGLVPAGHEQQVLDGLVAAIEHAGDHVTAGDIGFHYVVRALTDYGRSDMLFRMMTRTDAPSYGDQLAKGATTLTEAWDANPLSSQNHFMLGHAEEWFYRGLAGIDLDRSRPPAEQLRIQPQIVGTLTSATATYRMKTGMIRSSWHRTSAKAQRLMMDVTIPVGSTAEVLFPANYPHASMLGGKGLVGDRVDVKAGTYHFLLQR